jgi:hypothetical protein
MIGAAGNTKIVTSTKCRLWHIRISPPLSNSVGFGAKATKQDGNPARVRREGAPRWFYASEAILELYVGRPARQRQLAGAIRQVAVDCRRYVELMRLQHEAVTSVSSPATSCG